MRVCGRGCGQLFIFHHLRQDKIVTKYDFELDHDDPQRYHNRARSRKLKLKPFDGFTLIGSISSQSLGFLASILSCISCVSSHSLALRTPVKVIRMLFLTGCKSFWVP